MQNPELTHGQFLTIGITTYNRPEFLRETINSIFKQKFTDIEIIIANDYVDCPVQLKDLYPAKSNENNILRSQFESFINRIKIINHGKNIGEIETMNELLSLAAGRYFTWIADDDVFGDNCFKNLHSFISQDPTLQVVHTDYRLFSVIDEIATTRIDTQTSFKIFSGAEFVKLWLTQKLYAMGANSFYSLSILRQFGGVIKLTAHNQAFFSEYLLILKSGGIDKVGYITAPCVFYRCHQQSIGISFHDLTIYREGGVNLLQMGFIELARNNYKNFGICWLSLYKLIICNFIGKSNEANVQNRIVKLKKYGKRLLSDSRILGDTSHVDFEFYVIQAKIWLWYKAWVQTLRLITPSPPKFINIKAKPKLH